MPEPTDPWRDTIRTRLQELLGMLDATDHPDARLVAVHVSTALDCIGSLRPDDRPPVR